MRPGPAPTIALVGICCLSVWGQNRPPAPPAEPPVKSQPIPFSHKQHAQFLNCSDCHELDESGWEMTYPAEAKCMQCHSTIKTDSPGVMKLAEFFKDHKPVPWVKIYAVPDYVYFSHKVHTTRAKIACEDCHGPVAQRDVITKEKPTSMTACVDCHEMRHAPITCRSCHNR